MSTISQKDSDSEDYDDFLSEDDPTEGNNYQNTFDHDLSQFQGLQSHRIQQTYPQKAWDPLLTSIITYCDYHDL